MSATAEILIAEDTPEHAELALHAFKRHHLTNEVHVVGRGEHVLDFLHRRAAFEHREPAPGGVIVLLDLGLPDIRGLEVLGKIKADPELRATPVVMLTASNVGDDIKESFRLGADAYIVKPLTFQSFLDAVRQTELGWTVVAPSSEPA